MTGIEKLSYIKDNDFLDNIQEMTRCFVSQVNPLKIILFGSFANGTYTDESDYDFYLKVADTMLYDAKKHGRNQVVWADERMKQLWEKGASL